MRYDPGAYRSNTSIFVYIVYIVYINTGLPGISSCTQHLPPLTFVYIPQYLPTFSNTHSPKPYHPTLLQHSRIPTPPHLSITPNAPRSLQASPAQPTTRTARYPNPTLPARKQETRPARTDTQTRRPTANKTANRIPPSPPAYARKTGERSRLPRSLTGLTAPNLAAYRLPPPPNHLHAFPSADAADLCKRGEHHTAQNLLTAAASATTGMASASAAAFTNHFRLSHRAHSLTQFPSASQRDQHQSNETQYVPSSPASTTSYPHSPGSTAEAGHQ